MSKKIKKFVCAFASAFDVHITKRGLEKPKGYYTSRSSTDGADIRKAFEEIGSAMRSSLASK